MLISVVIPLFNKSNSIERAICSVLAQTHHHFELIIVDDGSTDDSYAKLNAYPDPRIKLFRQPNQGVSAARNKGVELASADYVAFLDADDCYHPHFLSNITNLIKRYDEAVLYCCRFQFVDEAGRTFTPSGNLAANFNGILPCFFRAFQDNRSLIHPSAMAVNKAAFLAAGGFPLGKAVGEDLQLMLTLALIGKVAADYQLAATVFRNAENRTADRVPASASCHIEYFLTQNDWRVLANAEQQSALLTFVYHNTLLHIAGACLNSQRALARRYARLLWQHKKLLGLAGFALSALPTLWLTLLKQRRNHA